MRSWRALLTELASPAVAARGALHKIADRLLRSKDLLGQVERRPAPGFPVAKAHAVVGCAFSCVATRCAPARCRVQPQPHLLLLKHLLAVLCCAGLRPCVHSRGGMAPLVSARLAARASDRSGRRCGLPSGRSGCLGVLLCLARAVVRCSAGGASVVVRRSRVGERGPLMRR